MNQNYRNAPDILFFAKRFLYRLGANYEDDSIAARKGVYGVSHVVEGNCTPSETVDNLIYYKEKLNTEWKDWFLLCRTNKDIDLFTKLCTDKGIPVDSFRQAELTNSEIEAKMKEDTLKVLTVHSAKGLENKCVCAFNIRAYNDEEARICYVAATRARDFLLWIKMPPKKKRKSNVVNWE